MLAGRPASRTPAALRRQAMRTATHADVLRDGLRRWELSPEASGQEPAAVEALRRELRRLGAIERELYDAADSLDGCGRALVQYECAAGHALVVPRWCCRSAICPDCARIEAARRVAIYAARVTAALTAAPDWKRPRLVTFPLKARETETQREAFHRLKGATARALRVLWLIPSSAADWRIYFALYPLTAAEMGRMPATTPGGRPRRPSAIERAARAGRRRRLVARRRRDDAGAVTAVEWGERGLNAHTHCLVLGRFIPQTIVAKCWALVTGDSRVVDIRAVKGGVRGAVAEVVKYLTKFTARQPDELAELYGATLSVAFSDRGDTVRSHRRVESVGCLRLRSEEEAAVECPAPRLCPTCGDAVRAVGIIPAELAALGVTVCAPEHRFKPRARGPT